MLIVDDILSDRGSKYAASGAECDSTETAKAFLKTLKRQRKFARAPHNSWELLTAQGPIKNDDGESGAGNMILRMLERDSIQNHIVVVT